MEFVRQLLTTRLRELLGYAQEDREEAARYREEASKLEARSLVHDTEVAELRAALERLTADVTT